jgi:MSHA biogenesis protein MshM
MYFDQHQSVENAIGNTISSIKDKREAVIIIIGQIGYGKTLVLHKIIDSLSRENYQFAFIENPDQDFHRLLKAIIGQLSTRPVRGKCRAEILEAFQQILSRVRKKGKRVLIFIDEAHAMPLSTLAGLKYLTDMQQDADPLFTLIFAGRPEFARRLEHPRCSGLRRHLGVHHQLAKIGSQELMRHYIEHRLRRAGTAQRLFTDDAYEAIWQLSENGVPRLINKLAKLAMDRGRSQGLAAIDAGLVRQIASRLMGLSSALTSQLPESSIEPRQESSDISRNADQEEGPMFITGNQSSAQPLMANMITLLEQLQINAGELSREQRLKLAGQLASEVLTRYPHLIQQLGSTNDPIPAWTILRNVLLQQLDQVLAKAPRSGEQIVSA